MCHGAGGFRGTEERTIDFLSYSPTLGLWGLGLYSFLASTLLPGGSEIALLALLGVDASLLWPALAVATLGNTAGGLTSWWCGRIMPALRAAWASGAGTLSSLSATIFSSPAERAEATPGL